MCDPRPPALSCRFVDRCSKIVTRWAADDNTGKTMLKEHELHHCRNDLLFKTQDYAVRACSFSRPTHLRNRAWTGTR